MKMELFKENNIKPKRFLFRFKFKENLGYTQEERDILASLFEAQNQIKMTYKNFDYVTNEELIDSYIYELKSLQMKYQYYLKMAKERKLLANKGD